MPRRFCPTRASRTSPCSSDRCSLKRKITMAAIKEDKTLDARGLLCPMPIVKAGKEMKSLAGGSDPEDSSRPIAAQSPTFPHGRKTPGTSCSSGVRTAARSCFTCAKGRTRRDLQAVSLREARSGLVPGRLRSLEGSARRRSDRRPRRRPLRHRGGRPWAWRSRVLETHVHADFISCARELAEAMGADALPVPHRPSEVRVHSARGRTDTEDRSGSRAGTGHARATRPSTAAFLVTDRARGAGAMVRPDG